MKTFLHSKWPIIALLAIGFLACITNYTPGTFLSGWDTLHPEFNFPLAFSRAFFGVFRPEQGLGAVAGHSHMADLPHIFLLAFLANFEPLSLLRYSYIFLCFLVGPVGMYFLLNKLLHNKPASFVGALFYMLNIGTVQNFYVPFEMFVVQYAALPYLFFFATDFLLTRKRAALVGFIAIVILSSPMAFAATLWYVTVAVFISYLSILSYLRHVKSHASLLIFLMLLLNLYWILPNLYFVAYHGKDVIHATTNQLFSEEAFLYNKAFGNFSSLALLHTFYFDWSVYSNQTFVHLMQSWITYLNTGIVHVAGYIFFAIACIGAFFAIKQKHPILVSLLPGLFLCLFFLLNDNLPLHLYNIFEKIPLFQEAFRFPDDKVLGIYVFLYTIFFSVGINTGHLFLKKLLLNTKYHILNTGYFVLLTTVILIVSFPIFQGQLISPAMRVAIPQEYFALFSYLNAKPYGRIATLPVASLWGWEYYHWEGQTHSFQGSGFLPFGLQDPTMDRDFDRWNSSNETYYREISTALYANNWDLFTATLTKYDISYILLDTSIRAIGQKKSALWIEPTKKLLSQHGFIPKRFGNHLLLYTLSAKNTSPVVAFSQPLPQAPATVSDYIDSSFATYGHYVTQGKTSPTFFSVNHLGILTNPPPLVQATSTPFASSNLFLPSFLQIAQTSSITNDCRILPFSSPIQESVWQKEVFFGYVRYSAQQGFLCDHITFPYPLDKHTYVLEITARNIAGLSLRVCVSDPRTGKCVIYTKLPSSSTFTTSTFFLPSFAGNKRFAVNLNTIGVAGTTSINDVQRVQVLEIPKSQISTSTAKAPALISIDARMFANASAIIFSVPKKTNTIVLFQAYEPGWHMYSISNPHYPISNIQFIFPFIFGKSVGKHVVVDNWANGWIVQNENINMKNEKFIIIFLPQYLEYFGFLITGVIIIALLFYCFIADRRHKQ